MVWIEARGRIPLPIVLLPDLMPEPGIPAGAAGIFGAALEDRRRLETLLGVLSVLVPGVRFRGVPYCVLDFEGVVVAP